MSRHHQASGWNNATKKARKKLRPATGQPCALCGRGIYPDQQKWHLDHIRPISQGGTDAVSNLRAVHAICNLKRSIKPKPTGENKTTFSRLDDWNPA